MEEVNKPRDQLRALVETLPEEMLPEALSLLAHLEDDEPLSPSELANVQSGREDIQQGHMTPLEDYERQRRL